MTFRLKIASLDFIAARGIHVSQTHFLPCVMFVVNFREEEVEVEYDELDFRSEDQYWLTDNALVIQDALPYSRPGFKSGQQKSARGAENYQNINPHAVNKLIRYILHKFVFLNHIINLYLIETKLYEGHLKSSAH